MTDINHRRKNRKPVNQRYSAEAYTNGIAPKCDKTTAVKCVGRTDYLDKSMHSWSRVAPLSGEWFQAGIDDDFTDGHRGMARAVRGAKQFVRTRVRFHENAVTRQLARDHDHPADR